jgi:hypothetical protein
MKGRKFERRKSKLENGVMNQFLTTDKGHSQDRTMDQLRKLIRRAWQFLRDATGENDYARYQAFTLSQGDSPMPPKAFYLSQLQRKYSRPNRCC